MTKVVILCGGLGTRLREETEFRPKPMVEVGGRPILWHIMKTYAHYGFREFVLCLGYRGNVIREYFLNYEAMSNDFTISLGAGGRKIEYHGAHAEQDFCVTLVNTGAETMTGGRVKRIEPFIDDDLFMVTYGDGLADIDIDALLAFHRAHGKMATVTAVRPVSRFGILELDEQGGVKCFAEKPQVEGWINAGYFIFHRRFFDYLKSGDGCIMEHEPLARAAADGRTRRLSPRGFLFRHGHVPRIRGVEQAVEFRSGPVEGLAMNGRDLPELMSARLLPAAPSSLRDTRASKARGCRSGCTPWGPGSRAMRWRRPRRPAISRRPAFATCWPRTTRPIFATRRPAGRAAGGRAGRRFSPGRPAHRSRELCQSPRDVRRQRDGHRKSAGSRPRPGPALRGAGDYQRQVL